MSALEIVQLMNREDLRVAGAVKKHLPAIAKAADEITERMRRGGRLIYVGAGSSGRLAVLDAAECKPTFGPDSGTVLAVIAGGSRAVTEAVEGAEDRREEAIRDLRKLRITKLDSIVGIAASGTTPYVLEAMKLGKRQGALTVGISADHRSPLARAGHIAISPETGPEVLTGSTRLKAGTAQKMVLNMLSTAVMVRLGHAYGNLMIDLCQSNEKLRERAQWILSEASGKSVFHTTRALRQSGHDLRVALVMLKRGVSAPEARRILHGASGNLREALGE
jgi:N-acetylmuramic acid 6-phosphate etherase